MEGMEMEVAPQCPLGDTKYTNGMLKRLTEGKVSHYTKMLENQQYFKSRNEASKTYKRVAFNKSWEGNQTDHTVEGEFTGKERKHREERRVVDCQQAKTEEQVLENTLLVQKVPSYQQTTNNLNSCQENPGNLKESSSFKCNKSRLQLCKKEQSSDKKTTMSKSQSALFYTTIASVNVKETPFEGKDNEEEKSQVRKQSSESARVEMEYYRLLSESVNHEEVLRGRDRKIQDLEAYLRRMDESMGVLQKENSDQGWELRELKKKAEKVEKEQGGGVAEWKKINYILSDSLVKLNQENSLLTSKLTQVENQLATLTSQCTSSNNLMRHLEGQVTSFQDEKRELLEAHKGQISELNEVIERLYAQVHSLENRQKQYELDSNKLQQEYEEEIKSSKFFEEESEKLSEQIKQLSKQVQVFQQEMTIKVQSTTLPPEEIKDRDTGKNISEMCVQQLREHVLRQETEFSQKEERYSCNIVQCEQRIAVLQGQIKEIREITSLMDIDEEGGESGKGNEESEERSLSEFKETTNCFQCIQYRDRIDDQLHQLNELRENIHLNDRTITFMQQQKHQQLSLKEQMISALKQKIQYLENDPPFNNPIQQLIPSRPEYIVEESIDEPVRRMKGKIEYLEGVCRALKTDNKGLNFQVRMREKMAEDMSREVQKHVQISNDLRGIMLEMNNKLVSQSELLDILNKGAIDHQLQYGNYKEQTSQTINSLGNKNQYLSVQLKNIYHQLDSLENKIKEQSESSERSDSEKDEDQDNNPAVFYLSGK